MNQLTVYREGSKETFPFEAPKKLSELLEENGIQTDKPCGGRGVCGKCLITAEGALSERTSREPKAGQRLLCQIELFGDASVFFSNEVQKLAIEGEEPLLSPQAPKADRLGAAVDIGTTTLCVAVYDLNLHQCIVRLGMKNPQTCIAADVIGRIDAALHGKAELLKQLIGNALHSLLNSCEAFRENELSEIVITGNTAMLYLLEGKNPDCLAHAPFLADHLFGETVVRDSKRIVFPPCIEAFVGADTVCAILSSGMLGDQEPALLCDIGTNGEIALWNQGKLYVASTAAGPVFEGTGIRCGCLSVGGAIDHAAVNGGKLVLHTIGGKPPIGICGSGLVSLIAALLEMEVIDETGAMEAEEYPIQGCIRLTRADVRAFQLGKAAISAGILTLLQIAGVRGGELRKMYIAGGFGSHMNVEAAKRTGLISSEIQCEIRFLGNAALDGAVLLFDEENRRRASGIQTLATPVVLSGNPTFNRLFVEQMMFE